MPDRQPELYAPNDFVAVTSTPEPGKGILPTTKIGVIVRCRSNDVVLNLGRGTFASFRRHDPRLSLVAKTDQIS